jgi:hypothetical protein
MTDGGRSKRVAESGWDYWPLPVRGNPWLKDATPKQLQQAVDYYTEMGQPVPQEIKRRLEGARQAKGGG